MGLPRADLGLQATPVQRAPRLSHYLQGPDIYVKRDDLTGLGLGGNKVRKLEYLFGAASKEGANVIISTASIYSNFLRILAAGACKMGWRCRLFVRGNQRTQLHGNYLCYKLMGAEIEYLDTEDPFSKQTFALMEEAACEEKAKGNTPYIINLGTHSAPLAILGYVDGYKEIFSQVGDFDHVVLAVGSGGTYAGLMLGAMLNESSTKYWGYSVNLPADKLADMIRDGIPKACELLGVNEPNIAADSVHIDDGFVGDGYAIPTQESIEAVRLMATTEGIILDPIYTGKALAGLIDHIQQGRIRKGERVLFLHTGGIPNTFAHFQAFERYFHRRSG